MSLPKPYFETKLGKLYCGDCLDILSQIPSQNIGLVVTDPPYNLAYTGRGEIAEGFANDSLNNKDWLSWLSQIVKELYRVLKDDCALYMWIDWRNYPHLFTILKDFVIKNCIVWHKNNFGMGQHYRYQHEFCIYAVKGNHKPTFPKRNISDIWRFKKEDVNSYRHPTQKPISVMRLPIEYSCNGVVLDPFLGSGTTAVACEKLGRRWVGIEISEKYCEIAAKRIANEAAQGKLF